MNLGWALDRAIIGPENRGGAVNVGTLNYEPVPDDPDRKYSLRVERPEVIFDLGNNVRIGNHKLYFHSDEPIADYAYRVNAGSQNLHLPMPNGSPPEEEFAENVVDIAGEPGPVPSYYYGRSEEVDNNVGTSNGNFRTLATSGDGF
jgi:hypothetical protein